MIRLPVSFLAMLLFLMLCGNANAQKKPKKELYVPMDYSTCGYHASESLIPHVPTVISLSWQEGDATARIQSAIDKVSQMKADNNGHRGSVVLGEGVWHISQPLRITTSGIVLRGMGRKSTTLVGHGDDRGALIYLEGKEHKEAPTGRGRRNTIREVVQDTVWLSDDKVTAGSTRLALAQASVLLRPGDRINIVRPCTRAWIEHLNMYDFGGGLDFTGWKPTDIDITWDRTITAIDGNVIHIDAPITTTLSNEWGKAYILKKSQDGELTECGIENLTIESAVNDWNPKDEDHPWDGITMDDARDCWVRMVNFKHLAGSAVHLQKATSRITVEDCIATEPVSEIGGWRRQVFLTRGQQTLFQRCISRQGIHDFAAGYCAAGPNAFVQCDSEESFGFSGSIGSWAAGLLFDIVNIDGNDLRYANLEQFQTGTGWNTANSMFWQCTAAGIDCYSPDADNRNSAHGCWGMLTGNGEWTSSNDHVNPRSLFYDQLTKRIAKYLSSHIPGQDLPPRLKNKIEQLSHILPRSLEATTSPTVEQATKMAQESLTTPRLTLEMWIDSIEMKTWQNDDFRQKNTSTKVKTAKKEKTAKETVQKTDITIIDAHLAHNGMLLTGGQYNIPWWNGRVKDNYVKREGRPAITRFVPGREGTGWTDRIDSVVNFLKAFHQASLIHNYGLWYDLRRTDHERVRRADGDVWAPFYEQPFARSGQGTAWDGLSRYDLTRPNRWYWNRLKTFAEKAAPAGILLFNQHYFQHNILEAGAHWVDCPWRPVNNINGTDFPEPVPFAGDKRIFLAEQFYNEQNEVLRPLHRQYIRMCLEQLKDQPNVVHLISAEYTGPLHFTRFWMETIAEWEAETGKHPLVALSCTRDVQDSIMADPRLAKVVDIIDIRYWHYNTNGLWAPQGGRNMAPRQWMRKMPAGKTGFEEVYRAVSECRRLYPDKAVTYYSQQYPENGWAVLFAGGSLPNIPIRITEATPLQQTLLADLCHMNAMTGQGCLLLGNPALGYLIHTQEGKVETSVEPGQYDMYAINARTGAITSMVSKTTLGGTYTTETDKGQILWLRRR